MKIMERIDDLRALVTKHLDRIRECRNDAACSGCAALKENIAALRADIDLLLAQWWAGGCKENSERDGKPDCACTRFTDGSSFAGLSPADKLAAAVGVFSATRFNVVKGTVEDALYAALEEYEATKNAAPLPAFLTSSGLLDEKKIARFLLDAMTGGALSSLICQLRDAKVALSNDRALHLTVGELDNLRSNLRALGENVDG